MTNDESNLNTVAIFHYVVGAISVLFACLPLIHMGIGLMFILGGGEWLEQAKDPPPPFFGWLFFGVGLTVFLAGQTLAICVLISGRFIQKRTHYLFSFVVACILCAIFPLGTVLGVFTIILLSKETIKEAYGQPVP